jgi:hypothetical protein
MLLLAATEPVRCASKQADSWGTGHPGSGLTRGRVNITMRITVADGQ